MTIRIVVVSDTHGFHRRLDIPDGDVFIHCGDITVEGEMNVAADFADWVRGLPHACKVITPGNHDFCYDISSSRYNERAARLLDLPRTHFLIDAARTLEVRDQKLRLYAAPWVCNLKGWAFWDRNRDRFESAPRDIDLLVTHGPPHGIRDGVEFSDGIHYGSMHLKRYVQRCYGLKLHVFGHVHEGFGQGQIGEIMFVNASTCTRDYAPTNPPLVLNFSP